MATVSQRPASGGIGESVLRKEDAAFITGQGRYVDDLRAARHAARRVRPLAVRRTPRSTASTPRRPRPMPGVVARHDRPTTLGLEGGVPCGSNPTGDDPPAARTRCWPRAASATTASRSPIVIASDRYAARDARRRGAGRLRPAAGRDRRRGRRSSRARRACTTSTTTTSAAPCAHETDGFDEAFAAGARVVKLREHQPAAHADRRWRRAASSPTGSRRPGEVTLYTSTQVPHFVRTFVGRHQRHVASPRCASSRPTSAAGSAPS